MKTFITSTALVALMVGAAPAMAACDIGKTTEYSKQDDAVRSPATRSDLRQLRNSAMILNTYKKDDACQSVVDAIQDIRETRAQQMSEAQTKTETKNKKNNDMNTGTTNVNNAAPDYMAVMADAQPVTKINGRLTVADMIDADIRGAKGKVVGEISDIVLTPEGKPSHAIVAFGGFLGLGEDRVAVPFEKLKVSRNVADQNDATFFVAMTEQQLKNAPHVKMNDDSWSSNQDWVSKNEEYYDNNSVGS